MPINTPYFLALSLHFESIFSNSSVAIENKRVCASKNDVHIPLNATHLGHYYCLPAATAVDHFCDCQNFESQHNSRASSPVLDINQAQQGDLENITSQSPTFNSIDIGSDRSIKLGSSAFAKTNNKKVFHLDEELDTSTGASSILSSPVILKSSRRTAYVEVFHYNLPDKRVHQSSESPAADYTCCQYCKHTIIPIKNYGKLVYSGFELEKIKALWDKNYNQVN